MTYYIRIERIRQTILEMLQQRGYSIIPAVQPAATDDGKNKKQDHKSSAKAAVAVPVNEGENEGEEEGNHPRNLLYAKKGAGVLCVFLSIIGKMDAAVIRSHIIDLQKLGVTHSILIYEGTPTPQVKTIIDNAANLPTPIRIETFSTEDCQINITKHVLVPKHELVPKEEAKQIKEKIGGELPILLKTDPVVRFFNFSKGDIVKITRRDGFVMYRTVK